MEAVQTFVSTLERDTNVSVKVGLYSWMMKEIAKPQVRIFLSIYHCIH